MEQARLAVLVGIDDYDAHDALRGCVTDAGAVADALSLNHDKSRNFTCELLTSDLTRVTRAALRAAASQLFARRRLDVALLFFAGHGTIAAHGACLVTQDGVEHDEGVPMAEIIALANASDAREKIIVLDCCHAGMIDELFAGAATMPIGEGVSILAACRSLEQAMESGNRGAFSEAVCAALEGGAADVRGRVTVASVYSFVDQLFATNEQRPVLKASVDKLVTLRTASASIDDHTLHSELLGLFPTEHHRIQLDKSYEPTEAPKHPQHEAAFAQLQRLRGARLVEPDGADHMYWAAMDGLTCSLTPLGRFYWRMAAKGKIS
jgi:hypothetical protein